MGMYNEVYKFCPECGGVGYTQIPQIVLGFGGFDLDNFKSIEGRLTVEEIEKLHEYVKDKYFTCQQADCHHHFKFDEKGTKTRTKQRWDELFGIG